MERDGNDAATQYYRWAFMAAVCREAAEIAQAKLLRDERVDTLGAYELAILELLKKEMYTKNDIASLSSLLMLGAYACKHVSLRTQAFTLQVDPQPTDEVHTEESYQESTALDQQGNFERP